MILWVDAIAARVSFVYTVNLNKCHCPLDESINQVSHTIKRCTSSMENRTHEKPRYIPISTYLHCRKLKTVHWHLLNAKTRKSENTNKKYIASQESNS